MNRPPSARDPWWAEHQRTCGGTYTKIKEPENYGKTGKGDKKKDKNPSDETSKNSKPPSSTTGDPVDIPTLLSLFPPVVLKMLSTTTSIFDHFHKIFMGPRIFCCMNIWTCSMSKERTEHPQKIARKLHFCQRLQLDRILYSDQNIDGVDRVHQPPPKTCTVLSTLFFTIWAAMAVCKFNVFLTILF